VNNLNFLCLHSVITDAHKAEWDQELPVSGMPGINTLYVVQEGQKYRAVPVDWSPIIFVHF
jgi:hypothetical protein